MPWKTTFDMIDLVQRSQPLMTALRKTTICFLNES